MSPPARPPSCGVRAFTLVEVTLALGIAAFCLVLLLGLLPTGLNAVQAGAEETAALQRLSAVLADVRATPLPTGAPPAQEPSLRYKLELSGKNTDGTTTATVTDILLNEQGNLLTGTETPYYRVGYKVVPRLNGEKCSRVYLRISWPGAAPANHSRGMSEIFATVNRDS